MTEYGLKDDSSLSPLYFTSDEKFNISKDKVIIISITCTRTQQVIMKLC